MHLVNALWAACLYTVLSVASVDVDDSVSQREDQNSVPIARAFQTNSSKSHVDGNRPDVTVDGSDGPTPVNAPQLGNFLEESKAKADALEIGCRVRAMQDIIMDSTIAVRVGTGGLVIEQDPETARSDRIRVKWDRVEYGGPRTITTLASLVEKASDDEMLSVVKDSDIITSTSSTSVMQALVIEESGSEKASTIYDDDARSHVTSTSTSTTWISDSLSAAEAIDIRNPAIANAAAESGGSATPKSNCGFEVNNFQEPHASAEDSSEQMQISCNGRSWNPSDPALWFADSSEIVSVVLDAAYSIPTGGTGWSLVKQVKQLPELQFLSIVLEHVDLNPDEVQGLLVAIGTITRLQNLSLDLSSTGVFRSSPVAHNSNSQVLLGVAGLGSLGNSANLHMLSLKLAANSIDSAGARDLSLGLARLSHLNDLSIDLSMNSIQDVGIWEIGASLRRLTHITSLTFRGHLCAVTTAGLIELLNGISALSKLSSMTIDVSSNNFGKEAGVTIGSALWRLSSTIAELFHQSLKIVSLNLSGTGLSLSHIRDLAKHLEQVERQGLDITMDVELGDMSAQLVQDEVYLANLTKGALVRWRPSQVLHVLRRSLAIASPALEAIPMQTLPRPASTTPNPVTVTPTPQDTSTPPHHHTPLVGPRTSNPATTTTTTTTLPPFDLTPDTPSSATSQFLPPRQRKPAEQTTTSVILIRLPMEDSQPNPQTDIESQEGASKTNAKLNQTTDSKHAVEGLSDMPDTHAEGRNDTDSSLAVDDQAHQGSLDASFAIVGVLICIGGFALLYGGNACASRGRAAQRDADARMSMLGSSNSNEAQVRTQPFASTKQMARPTTKRKDERIVQSNNKVDDDEGNDSENNFASFGSFPDASSSTLHEHRAERTDSANSDSLEAILEAQIAALGEQHSTNQDGSSDDPFPAVKPQSGSSHGPGTSTHTKQESAVPKSSPSSGNKVALAKSTSKVVSPQVSQAAMPKGPLPKVSAKASIPHIVPKFKPPEAAPTSVTPKWPVIAPPR